MKQPEYQPEPDFDCQLCPRLYAFRQENAAAHPEWFNGPVHSFGDPQAQFLILGLAPGLQGANKTGRPFTGDYAGDLLYATLEEFGYSLGTYQARPDDGLTLKNCMISNAVRCVPPQNKPIGAEINACRGFLKARLNALPNLQVILALGRIAHDTLLRTYGVKLSAHPFGHGAQHRLEAPDLPPVALVDSYHCSRYNTNTRRLTPQMFGDAFRVVKKELDAKD
jgi:uracil-DNA glycosylase family 4